MRNLNTFIEFQIDRSLVQSHCSAIIKQPCLITTKIGNNQREKLTVKNISTNIFRHVDHSLTWTEKEKKILLMAFRVVLKIKWNVEF